MSIHPDDSRARIAFFQRVFAHYQAGLVKELAQKSKHDFHFFGDERDPLKTGIEPIPLSLRKRTKFTVCRTVHWGKQLSVQPRSIIESFIGDFDVYIFEGNYKILTNWLAIIIVRFRGKKSLLYTHGWLWNDTGSKAILRRLFYKLANGLLLYGNHAKEIAIVKGFPPETLFVAYNSLDADAIENCRGSCTPKAIDELRKSWFGPDYARPLIAGVGRLTKEKEFTLLLDAADLLAKKRSPINIVLVGDGPERNMLEKKARELDITLCFTGNRYDEEFLSLCFAAADMTVIPGAAGLTVIHSLAYGTPVIVHNNANSQMPESEAILDGVNGAIFRSGDPYSLVLAIESLLGRLGDGSPMEKNCLHTVDSVYTPSHMRSVFDNAINQIIDPSYNASVPRP